MFTTGSKFFFGLSVLGLVAFVVNAIQTGFSPLPTMALGMFVGATAFLGFVTIAFRDAEAPVLTHAATSAADAEGRSAAGARVPNSPWPLLGGFGLAAAAVGLVVDPWLFWFGVVILVAVAAEWMVQGWADRASDDPDYNARLRSRTMNPFEFPIAGVLIAAVVVVSFSRVMLALSEHGAVIAFSVLAGVIFILALVLAARPALRTSALAGLLLVGGVAMIAVGIAAAAQGEREFEVKDKGGSTEGVSDTSSVAATITLQGNAFQVQQQGKEPIDNLVLEVPRATTVNLVFRNTDTVDHTFVVVTKEPGPDGQLVDKRVRTGTLSEGQSQDLAVSFPAPGLYEFYSEGGPVAVKGNIRVP